MTPTLDQLRAFCPAAVGFADGLQAGLARWPALAQPRVLAHLLAQIAHESQAFTRTEENLNYSAERMREVWPHRFSGELAASYARNPQAIANHVYASRMGNGDEASEDGWRFRGRGLVQITGRAMYTQCSTALYHDDRLLRLPGLLCDPIPAALSACWYFVAAGCVAPAQQDNLVLVRRRINGGGIGLHETAQWLDKAKRAIDPPQGA